MRSDAESVVITLWVVLALLLLVTTLYFALAGPALVHVVVIVVGELVLAGIAKLALRAVRGR